MDFSEAGTVTLGLKIRRQSKKGMVENCEATLIFVQLIEVNISEDFRTGGGYSDFTFQKLENEFYLSLDPFGNSGTPNEQDNFVIRSRKFLLIAGED
jgi:hypothetical protein